MRRLRRVSLFSSFLIVVSDARHHAATEADRDSPLFPSGMLGPVTLLQSR